MFIPRIVRDGILAVSLAMCGLLVLAPTAIAADVSVYRTVTAAELKSLLLNEDIFLLDVHIPEQNHIPGTDAFIDFRKIRENRDLLPADKTAKIVVYCRSGNMSEKAAHDLIDLGYSQVYDLVGGTVAFWP